MKKIIKIFILLLMVVTSCEKDVLDKMPLDIISDDVVWDDPALINAYLVECYADIFILANEAPNGGKGWENFWESASWTTWGFINDVSDEGTAGYNPAVNGFKYGGLTITGGLLEWWELSYSVIRQLNVFIEKLPLSIIDDDLKNGLLAEARFLRAINYFAMVKRYGGVPLITIPQDAMDSEESLYPVRDKEQDVYDYIISEIDDFHNDLPEISSSSDYGRPTKYAALALKCRAALYAGSIANFGNVQLDGVVGINASQANYYYDLSYEAAKLIMTSGNYSLYNNYPGDKVMNFAQLFLDEGNSETIFARRFNDQNALAGGNGWSYDFFQGPYPNGWGQGNKNAPYLEMVEEFEYIDGSSGKFDRTAIQQGLWTMDDLWGDRDPRFFATVYTNETPWQGSLLDYHKGILLNDGTIIEDGSYEGILANGTQNIFWGGTGFGVKKYLNEAKVTNEGPWATSSQDWLVFRFGEVLLNYAEAAINLGKSGDALDAVNQIRSRAGIASLTSIDSDKIRHERKVELAYEGHRYWDLRRWRTAETILSQNNSGLIFLLDYDTKKYEITVVENIDGTVTPPAFYSQNYYLPITIKRTGNNTNLVENPGY